MTTLLTGVNEVLKKVGKIAGASGELSSLTESARQVFIDGAVQAWNEVIDEIYSTPTLNKPQIMAEGTITLATSDRDYALASDVTRIIYPLTDRTNGLQIFEYPGGYDEMTNDQLIPANYTGLANYAAIRPTDGQLYLDRIPTSTENGRVYTYKYEKDGALSAASDTFPFSDKVYRSLVPAVAEIWNREQKQNFDAGIFAASMGRAARYLRSSMPRDSWVPRRYSAGGREPDFLSPFDGNPHP